MKRAILPVLLASALLVASASGALNRDGIPGINKTFSSQPLGNGHMGFGVYGQLIDDELMLQDGQIDRNGSVQDIKDYFIANNSVFLSLGLGPYTDISLALPFYYELVRSESGALEQDELKSGDLRYRLKVQFPFEDLQVLHISLLLGGSAPTQFDRPGVIPRELEYYTNDITAFDEGNSPFGAGRPTFLAALGLTLDLGQVAEKFQFLWHFNGGVRKINITSDPPFQDILFWSVAAEYEASTFIRFFAEFYHESRFDALGDEEFASEPTSLTLGGVAQTPVGLDFYAGVITGFNNKFIPVSYPGRGTRRRQQLRHEGHPRPVPLLPGDLGRLHPHAGQRQGRHPEQAGQLPGRRRRTRTASRTRTAAPIPTTTRTASSTRRTSARSSPRTRTASRTTTAAPRPTTTRTASPMPRTSAPTTPRTRTASRTTTAAPTSTTTATASPTWPTSARTTPRTATASRTRTAAPRPTTTRTASRTRRTSAPTSPETFNKFEDEDGCPDKVSVIEKTMVLKGVNFRTGSAELTPESFRVLDDIVPQFQAYPEMEFEVAGHTDNKGNPTKNQMLSQARAQTVANYFISKGVDAKRLKVMGYGSSRPLAPNTSAEGRALNRRVELNRQH